MAGSFAKAQDTEKAKCSMSHTETSGFSPRSCGGLYMYKVAITYNLKKKNTSPELPVDYFSEFDSPKTVNAIKKALVSDGNEVVLVEANMQSLEFFIKNKVDMVFNIAEGVNGMSRESQVPAILDFIGIPYTGSDVLTLAIALDKAVTKKIFCHENIPTPGFQLFKSVDDKLSESLKFPLIVKPNCEGSAKGLSVTSVVRSPDKLYEEVKKAFTLYKQEVLVEEFIEGKELTVGILGNENPTLLPVIEVDFRNCKKSGEFFYSWRMKEFQGDASLHLVPEFFCPARLDEETERIVKDVALKAHRALGCFDLSRVDIRLSGDNIPYVLEVNPLPGLDPDESNLTIMTRAANISYNALINGILKNAQARYLLKLTGPFGQKGSGKIVTGQLSAH
jgi:D-alanine-D-alanine ligase